MQNTVDAAPAMFELFRAYGLLPAEKYIYFQDNLFTGNIFKNQKNFTGRFGFSMTKQQAGIYGLGDENAKWATSTDFITGNNIFTNNNFGTNALAPTFNPEKMVVDGGGNICGFWQNDNYPLKCGQQAVKVILPNGGERWEAGSTQKISWSLADNIPPDQAIAIYLIYANKHNSGSLNMPGDIKLTDRSWNWIIPNGQLLSDDYKIEIQIYSPTAGSILVFDQSDSPISIIAKGQ